MGFVPFVILATTHCTGSTDLWCSMPQFGAYVSLRGRLVRVNMHTCIEGKQGNKTKTYVRRQIIILNNGINQLAYSNCLFFVSRIQSLTNIILNIHIDLIHIYTSIVTGTIKLANLSIFK